MLTTYLVKMFNFEFDEMINFMEQSDEIFMIQQIIKYNKTYEFVIVSNDNIVKVLSANHISTNQPKKVNLSFIYCLVYIY